MKERDLYGYIHKIEITEGRADNILTWSKKLLELTDSENREGILDLFLEFMDRRSNGKNVSEIMDEALDEFDFLVKVADHIIIQDRKSPQQAMSAFSFSNRLGVGKITAFVRETLTYTPHCNRRMYN